MPDQNRNKLDVAAGRAPGGPTYCAGFDAGDESRSRGDRISTLRLVAINDEYSAGFRAGYFHRGR